MHVEKDRLKLGFIPLIDCAALAVAKEQGFFEAEGLTVELVREVSWANIRDKVCIGALDGAQMLAPMPLAATLGLSGVRTPMIAAMSLGLNGNAITVSNALYEQLLARDARTVDSSAQCLKALEHLVDARRREGAAPLTFAAVYPFSCHNYQLRYWLAAGGIDPDHDVNLVVIPPPRTAAQLQAGRIDGFCVGEPWNQAAVAAGCGKPLVTGYAIWNNAPEKVFAVRANWAKRYPETLQAVLRALLQAAAWIEQPRHLTRTAILLSQPHYLNLDEHLIAAALAGGAEHTFHRYAANFPWRSHAIWLLTQMYRWRQLTEAMDIVKTAAQVYRADLYRCAAAALSIHCPSCDDKDEGRHAEEWRMAAAGAELVLGPDRFIDGRIFNPAESVDYIYGFEIAHIGLPRAQLKARNPAIN
jgi:nitrate/nitrite transport system substrate-binding protein